MLCFSCSPRLFLDAAVLYSRPDDQVAERNPYLFLNTSSCIIVERITVKERDVELKGKNKRNKCHARARARSAYSDRSTCVCVSNKCEDHIDSHRGQPAVIHVNLPVTAVTRETLRSELPLGAASVRAIFSPSDFSIRNNHLRS